MAKIYLLRHGEVSGPAALYGDTDVGVAPLVNAAIADQLSELALNIHHIISSPLERCLSLAKLVQADYQSSLRIELGLKEMNFGRYDGVAYDQLYQEADKWRPLELFWQNPVQHPLPQAELLTGFSFRVLKAWHQVLTLATADSDNNYLVVCHGGVIRMILAQLLNVDYRNPDWYTQLTIANASLTEIDYQQAKCRVLNIAKPLLGNGKINDDFSGHNQKLLNTLSEAK